MGDYEYVQQRAYLNVQLLKKRIEGVVEIVFIPKKLNAGTIRLHARQLQVLKVHLNDTECAFTQHDFLSEIVDENYRDANTFDLYYRGAIVASKEGELVIPIPRNFSFQESDQTQISESDLDLPKSSQIQPITVRIEYILENPNGGIRFVIPDKKNMLPSQISPHMYTHCGPFGGLCDGARTWMPCRDTLKETCTFLLEITVPSYCIVISSGTLSKQLFHPKSQTRTFQFKLDQKMNCSSIGFAIGPFRMFTPQNATSLTHFALPEAFQDVSYCTLKLSYTMEYLEKYLNRPYPFQLYSQIFVSDPPETLQYFAGVSILDQNILHSAKIIDRELNSHLIQAKGLIGSWIQSAVRLQTTKTAWVLIGVIGYVLNTYIKSVYGEEEHGYRIQLAMDALTTMEVMNQNHSPSLLSSEVDVYAEYEPAVLPFLEVKAPLVLHMIEQRVGSQHLNLAIQRVVAPVNIGPSAVNEALTTSSFLKTIKAIAGASGQDLTKSFLSIWIVDSGMAFFTVGYWYNRKQTQAEIVLQQQGAKLFTGSITITIVEDTSEYTYQKRVESRRHKWDFPCHSKVRKKRRRRQGLSDPDDSVSVNGPGMGLNDTPVFWVKIDTGCSWLRHLVLHQPDFNWMEQLLSDKKVGSRVHAARALALFHRPHEKPNVVSCRVLTECMSGLTTHSRRLRAEAALSLGIWQSIHAPLTVANTSLPIYKAMHNLFRIFKDHFFDRSTDMPLPNYFLPSGGKVMLESLGAQQASLSSKQIQIQDYAAGEYEIKKTIPRALSMIRAQNGYSPPEIEAFLLQLLCENDNSKNYVEMDDVSQVADHCFYIGSIILSLSQLHTPVESRCATPTEDKVIAEIMRYLRYDQVQPSYCKIITVCCLEALCNLILSHRTTSKTIDFHAFASPKHGNAVRKAAIESILRLFFAEKEAVPTEAPWTFETVYGAMAALLYAIHLLQIEKSQNICLFIVQVCLNCLRSLPPITGMQVLATWEHQYTLKIMSTLQMHDPTAFILQSPDTKLVNACFPACDLQVLQKDSPVARYIIERLWQLMNVRTAMNQRLRVALLSLYRFIWGEQTPLAVAHTVDEKPASYAGGYESLRLMMEENRVRSFETNKSVPSTPPYAHSCHSKSTLESDAKRVLFETREVPVKKAKAVVE